MSFTRISTRLGGVTSASVLGKTSGTAGCFPIAGYVLDRIIIFRCGMSGDNSFYFRVWIFMI